MASTFIRTIIIYFILTFSMKIMGKREIGEMEVSELVCSLLLSEICSIPIDNPDIPLFNAIIPVLFIVSLEIILSFVKNKSKFLKKLVDGKPSYLIYEGKFNEKVLRNNRISLEEFFAEMRSAGISSVDNIEYCILESNGKISMLEKECGPLGHLLIADGEINEKSLSLLNIDENTIKKLIGNRQIEDVFLLSMTAGGKPYIIYKEEN